jgi:ribosomal protein L3
MTTFYRIQWPWIALHALLVLAGTAFLAITIVETKHVRVPAWKSSSVAPLSCSAEIGDVLAGIESIEIMEERASQHRVRLFGDEKYQRVGEEDTEPDPVGQCPKIGSIKKVKALNLPQPSSRFQKTEPTPQVAEIRDKTIGRKPVARGSS